LNSGAILRIAQTIGQARKPIMEARIMKAHIMIKARMNKEFRYTGFLMLKI